MSQRQIDTLFGIGYMTVVAFGLLWAGREIVLNKYAIDLLTMWK